MNILGLMRIKNEARWIERCVRSMLPVCEQILILDDHSTDGTQEICRSIPGVTVIDSPHSELNEVADKNLLLRYARELAPAWILLLDGDEMLSPGTADLILDAARQDVTAWAFQVLYLWNREDQIRMDGGYSRFWRPSMFRLTEHQFHATNAAGGFHCGNAPIAQQRQARRLAGSALLHFGYLHREDRLRKYEWYRGIDGQNPLEDGYRHMVIGDVFPAESAFRHGGPLQLEALPCAATAI
jgi:glycosyltransferase involved in cell wall biosynthesis